MKGLILPYWVNNFSNQFKFTKIGSKTLSLYDKISLPTFEARRQL